MSTTIPIGSLATRALLVDLDVSFWEGFRRDKKITGEVAVQYNTDGNYNKRLIPKGSLKELTTALNVVVQIHKQRTLPWSDNGTRVISSELVLRYRDEMNKAIQVFDDARIAFAEQYKWLLQDKAMTDRSFNADDYPAVSEIINKYAIHIAYFPIPQGADLRVDLSKDVLAVIRQSINADQESRIQIAIQDIANRIREIVEHMVERLNAYAPPKNGNKAEGTFRNSLVENVRELADMLPGLNIIGDPKIDAMAAELKALAEVGPDTLRDDPRQRRKTVKQAEAILQKVSEFI